MSFSISFFARDVSSAHAKLREAYGPAALKALIELSIAGIPHEPRGGSAGAGQTRTAAQAAATDRESVKQAVNRPGPTRPTLCGILVESLGHIDEHGGRSSIGLFRVEPYYDS